MVDETNPSNRSRRLSLIEHDDENRWEKVAKSLCEAGGVAIVEVSPSQGLIHQRCFGAAKRVLDATMGDVNGSGGEGDGTDGGIDLKQTVCIPPEEDSAHATGYHPAGGVMSRYNLYREGFVFSDGQTIKTFDGVNCLNENNDGFDKETPGPSDKFSSCMEDMFQSLHDEIAQNVLRALSNRWGLPSESSITGHSSEDAQHWFQSALGPTSTSSQWHVKRYVPKTNAEAEKNEADWLPVHTDPSIISVVVHDSPGVNAGCLGLEYQVPATPRKEAPTDTSNSTNKGSQGFVAHQKEYVEFPHHGHRVAIIMVGSVLSFQTGAIVPGAKHRVVFHENDSGNGTRCPPRMAATLFVRPQPKAILQAPPCPLFKPLRKKLSFEAWNARVARNYQKKTKTKKSQPKVDTVGKNGGGTPDGISDTIDVYRDEHTELTLLPCNPPLTGQEKFLGGELASNGKIYTVPGHAKRVVLIDCNVEPPTIAPIGPVLDGDYKWLRGVRMEQTGIIYAIPCHADSVLRIDPTTDTVSTLHWDETDPRAPAKGMPWKWHGGQVAPLDGCLYCIPQYAEYVLKIDPITEQLSFLDGPRLVGRNKWYGGLVAGDGCIYGIQQNARGALKIDPSGPTVSTHGDYPEGGYKWHGGVTGPDGCIYGIPAHADTVLKISPGDPPSLKTIGTCRTGQHRTDGKYKYLGGAVGHDGMVYFFPSDADYVLQVDPKKETVREVGPNLRELERVHNNKWQNGFTAPDGTIYGIPLKSSSVLRIRPQPDGRDPEVTTIGGPYQGLNKWEGGVMSQNGDMYCMPLTHSKVLRMRPLPKQEGTT